jgi:hypothetical protein
VEPSDQLADAAVRLAEGGELDRDAGVNDLVRLSEGDVQRLEDARQVLVRRLLARSNDYAATKGLTLLNAAIARVGWPDPVAWKPRKWRIPR